MPGQPRTSHALRQLRYFAGRRYQMNIVNATIYFAYAKESHAGRTARFAILSIIT